MENQRDNLTKVKEVLSLTTDLFGYINYDFSSLDISNETFDFFFQTRYQERWCSPVLELFINNGEISSQSYGVIGNHILSMFQSKWNRMVNVALSEYDPLHNYFDELTEEITDNDDTTRDDDSTTTDTISRTTANETGVFGFNSNESVGFGDNSGSVSETDSKVYSNDSTINRDYTRERNSTHKGNIGNLSYQNLLGQEIELWKWNIIDQVVSDVASVLTLNIY